MGLKEKMKECDIVMKTIFSRFAADFALLPFSALPARRRAFLPAFSLCLVISLTLIPGKPCLAQDTRPLPIFPQSSTARPESKEKQRAKKLYALARKENPSLKWDDCLASRAFTRAKRMVAQGYFEHEDPNTGENPAWKLVEACIPAGSKRSRTRAGENLSKGIDSAENIHRALMKSPTHRKNIMDRRFNRMGVGCSSNICVELFAGY
jgi:hypothetical protein